MDGRGRRGAVLLKGCPGYKAAVAARTTEALAAVSGCQGDLRVLLS